VESCADGFLDSFIILNQRFLTGGVWLPRGGTEGVPGRSGATPDQILTRQGKKCGSARVAQGRNEKPSQNFGRHSDQKVKNHCTKLRF